MTFNPQPKSTAWRSEKHRKNVARLACVICGREGSTQAAHVNFGKGMGCKASDALVFAACVQCHQFHDQGGIVREHRRRLEFLYLDRTRVELIARFLWPAEVELAYSQDVVALREVVGV